MSDKCEVLFLAQARDRNGNLPAESRNTEEAVCQLPSTNWQKLRGLPAAGTSQVSHMAGGEADEHKHIAPLSSINFPQKFMSSFFGLPSST